MKKSLILAVAFVFALAVCAPVATVAQEPVKKEQTDKSADKKEGCNKDKKEGCCKDKAKPCGDKKEGAGCCKEKKAEEKK